MWGLGSKARGFALGLVLVAFTFCALWVGIGAGIHTQYETPTPVCCLPPLLDSILTTDIIYHLLVLVLDQSRISSRTPCRRICLAVGGTICITPVHPIVLLGGRSLVFR
jgi:hypothetical protein